MTENEIQLKLRDIKWKFEELASYGKLVSLEDFKNCVNEFIILSKEKWIQDILECIKKKYDAKRRSVPIIGGIGDLLFKFGLLEKIEEKIGRNLYSEDGFLFLAESELQGIISHIFQEIEILEESIKQEVRKSELERISNCRQDIITEYKKKIINLSIFTVTLEEYIIEKKRLLSFERQYEAILLLRDSIIEEEFSAYNMAKIAIIILKCVNFFFDYPDITEYTSGDFHNPDQILYQYTNLGIYFEKHPPFNEESKIMFDACKGKLDLKLPKEPIQLPKLIRDSARSFKQERCCCQDEEEKD
jgi:hypothetical protein